MAARAGGSQRQSALTKLSKTAFNHLEADSAFVRAGVTVLRLVADRVDKHEAATDAVALVTLDADMASTILAKVSQSRPSVEARETFNVTASRQLLQKGNDSPDVYRILSNFVEAQKTGLDEARLSQALELPLYNLP